jgi:homoserine dehydrogenase
MLPKDYLIAKVDGPFNAIYVDGDATGSTLYYGRGAGSVPTGSAVVSDIADIARNIRNNAVGRVPTIPTTSGDFRIKKIDDVLSRYYFRFSAIDKPGVLSKISGILGNYNISITSVIQKGRKVGEAVPLVVLTHEATEKNVRQAIGEIDVLPVVMDKTVFIRVEGKEEIS